MVRMTDTMIVIRETVMSGQGMRIGEKLNKALKGEKGWTATSASTFRTPFIDIAVFSSVA